MYIHYSIGNNSGPRTLVRIVEVSIIGGVCFRRFHLLHIVNIRLYKHSYPGHTKEGLGMRLRHISNRGTNRLFQAQPVCWS